MILEHQFRMDNLGFNNNVLSGCSNGKCYNCPFSLICSKSPMCILKNIINNGQDTENVENILSNIKVAMDNINNNMGNTYISAMEQIKTIPKTLEVETNNSELETKIQNFQNELFELYNKLSEQIEYITQRINDITTSNIQINTETQSNSVMPKENNIIPYQNNNEEIPTYVEKKTIFGKTKWVEKK